ncbi:MAG: hypothetical protein KAT62_05875 [Desulfuromonadales bacterium]|nr:hypothetical protein [Chloroflexota bacterium]MCK4621728.1 hypothetical protein [Desulfuromonadales bacterium]
MNWADFKEFMTNFRTDRIMQQLEAWDVADLSSNPWFLGGFAAAILLAYFLGLRATSAFLVGIGGFALAVSWTVAQGVGTAGIESGGVYIIIGGGTVIVGLFIYLLFIKSE